MRWNVGVVCTSLSARLASSIASWKRSSTTAFINGFTSLIRSMYALTTSSDVTFYFRSTKNGTKEKKKIKKINSAFRHLQLTHLIDTQTLICTHTMQSVQIFTSCLRIFSAKSTTGNFSKSFVIGGIWTFLCVLKRIKNGVNKKPPSFNRNATKRRSTSILNVFLEYLFSLLSQLVSNDSIYCEYSIVYSDSILTWRCRKFTCGKINCDVAEFNFMLFARYT